MQPESLYPTLSVPPLVHAKHHWNAETGELTYQYNGRNIITIQFDRWSDVGFRHGSDGTMQSISYLQQIYLSTDTPANAKIKFCLNADCINMRPHRARKDQAILGQVGTPLIHGVNGLYDPAWDLLLDWNGRPWRFLSDMIVLSEDRQAQIEIEVACDQKAFYLNIRPQYYRKHLGYVYHEPWLRRPNPRALAGWCSWEAYRRDISISRLEEIADKISSDLLEYGLSILQADDGYQRMPLPYLPEITMAEGWMACDETKFPNGHGSIVETALSHRLMPAIWVNANITNPAFAEHFPDAVIHYKGQPLLGEWIDYLYNCTDTTLRQHVVPLFENLRKLGYQYVKIDAIRHLLYDGLHECVRLGSISNEEAQHAFRAFMEATRRGLGSEIYYLASWGVMQEVVGTCDACRISMDANPTWAGIRMQLFETARWFHTQRILFTNDPDHVCVRTNPEWARSVLSLVSLSGELYMLSDMPEAYTGERLSMIQETLPPLVTYPAETGPFLSDFPAYTWTKLHGFAVQSSEAPVSYEQISTQEAENIGGIFPTMEDKHPFSTLWAFHIRHAGLQWCVMTRIATTPLCAGSIDLDSLGLDPSLTYTAFDYWRQEYLGVVKGELQIRALDLGCCQVVALHPVSGFPSIIASSRHVSMDAVSILEHRFSENTLLLTLKGIQGREDDYFLSVPEPWEISGISSEGCAAHYDLKREIIRLSVVFQSKLPVTIQISFERNSRS